MWRVCPHAEADGCACRKPVPGLVLSAASSLRLAPASCVVVGDTGADVGAGVAAGATAILVPTERTLACAVRHVRQRALVARTLSHAVDLVVAT